MCISDVDLKRFCEEIYRDYGTTLAICEIFGKRWSFLAGNGDSLYAGVRIQLNEKYGLIADDIPETIRQNVLNRLKEILLVND